MRNILLLVVLLISFVTKLAAQSQEPENVLLYALPKTVLHIKVELDKITQTPGQFMQYSERYLATRDVITEKKTSYVLKRISLSSEAIPDANRTYSVLSNDFKDPAWQLVLNERGILCGINCDRPQPLVKAGRVEKATRKASPKSDLLPMGEEYMLVGSVAKLAEGAAKQIYRIRENRLNLLSGDVENYPSDGKLYLALMADMDKKEKELTELFLGKTVVETEQHEFRYVPENPSANEVLFRLSPSNGIAAQNTSEATPYYISLQTLSLPAELLSQKSRSGGSPLLRCILPASTQVKISDGKKEYVAGYFDIPQFGSVQLLTDQMLKGKGVKLEIDPQTGRLLKLTRDSK